MNPFLNNDNNTLLIHLHLAKAVPVQFQIIPKNSNCLQQKIPIPYRRNRDTVCIQNIIKFNQLCLIFSLQITIQVHELHSVHFFFSKLSILVIYSLKCLFAFSFQYQSDAVIIFFSFQLAFLHTNLNLVHVLVLASSFCSSSIVISLFSY